MMGAIVATATASMGVTPAAFILVTIAKMSIRHVTVGGAPDRP
ncbi:unnamed protein product [Ectocarpus fasciculatus]